MRIRWVLFSLVLFSAYAALNSLFGSTCDEVLKLGEKYFTDNLFDSCLGYKREIDNSRKNCEEAKNKYFDYLDCAGVNCADLDFIEKKVDVGGGWLADREILGCGMYITAYYRHSQNQSCDFLSLVTNNSDITSRLLMDCYPKMPDNCSPDSSTKCEFDVFRSFIFSPNGLFTTDLHMNDSPNSDVISIKSPIKPIQSHRTFFSDGGKVKIIFENGIYVDLDPENCVPIESNVFDNSVFDPVCSEGRHGSKYYPIIKYVDGSPITTTVEVNSKK